MRENTNSQGPSLDTATWLRQADKFVKEKSFEAALDAIAKARQLDPTNPYALAYEERVRALMRDEKAGAAPGPSKKDTREEDARTAPPPLEQISHLAMQQAQSTAAASALQQHNMSVRKRQEEDRKLQEENRRTAILSKLSAFLARAQQCLEQEEFDRALGEISRALLLDPKNAEALSFEERVRTAQDETNKRREKEHIQQLEEEERKRQEQLQTERERLRQEQQEKKKKEDEARRNAQRQKIDQYLSRTSALLAAGRLQEAQNELAFVVVIDPLNPQVLKLQQQIRDAQETQRKTELELRRRKDEEERRKQEAMREAIQKHIENATKLAALGSFNEALRVVTLAYVLDPMSEDTQTCENNILAAQESALRRAELERKAEQEQQRHQTEEEQQRQQHAENQQFLEGNDAENAARTRENQEKCQAHLAKAAEHLSRQQFEGALAEVALAFMIDPFSDAVKQMEQEVRNAQSEHLQKHGDSGAGPTPADYAATTQQITEHVAAAHHLREQGEYSKALDELAKAFILDPLDPTIQQCEEAIQAGLTAKQHPAAQKQTREQQPETTNIDERIVRAQEFIARESYDDALSEIALGLMQKPDDKTLQHLESSVWELKSRTGSGARGSRSENTTEGSRAQRDDLIRTHLRAAESLIRKREFTKALDELAEAFVLDPLNAEATKLEARIRQQQASPKARFQDS